MLKAFNFKSDFFKNVLVLTSGTVLSQAVAYLLIPIITRLYTPEDNAEMALYIRIIGVGSAIATLKYELALPIVSVSHHAFQLYKYTVRITLLISLISCLCLVVPVFFYKDLSDFLFYLSIPLGIGLTALTYIGTNWSLRLKDFKWISITKMVNSFSTNGSKVLFGVLNFGYIGLILGTVLGALITALFFLKDYFVSNRKWSVRWRSKRNYIIARQFSEFPKSSLPHQILDMLRDLLFASLLWELYGKAEYGYYSHTYQMLRMPLMLVGASISQVFFQRCAEKLNNGVPIYDVALASIRLLALLSIIPFSIVFFFGADLFAIVFGANWKEAGVYAEIMAVWLMMNFILSPLSILPLLLKKQRAFFYWNILGNVAMVCALIIPSIIFKASIYFTLWTVSISQAIYFVLMIFFMLHIAKNALNGNAYSS